MTAQADRSDARPVSDDRQRLSGGVRRRDFLTFGAVGAASMLGTSCLPGMRHQHLGEIYSSAARRHGPNRNPIIVIPGILGSRLIDSETDETVWGVLGGGYIRKQFEHLAVPMEKGRALVDLTDATVPGDVLDRLSVHVGATLQVKAYAQLLGALGVGGYRDETLGKAGAIDYGEEHFTCFQFGYDWRRSSAENARRLDQFIQEKKTYVEGENRRRFGETRPVRFDLVAHSMGGLVARYYLRHGAAPLPENGGLPPVTWAGAKHIDKAILVGTPNGGSSLAADQLVNGWRPAAFLQEFPPALLATMPSIYELLPRSRDGKVLGPDGAPLDLFDPEQWVNRELGLFGPGQDKSLARLLPATTSSNERSVIARDHLEKCLANADQFHRTLDRPAKLPAHTRLYLFAGDATDTTDVVEITGPGSLKMKSTALGDGTVTRNSALRSTRAPTGDSPYSSPVDWTHATFIAADHLGLTSDPTFTDNVLHLLLEA